MATRPAAPALTVIESEPLAGPAPRVLVVDDEPSMRQMLSYVLKREGYDVVVASNGGDALRALSSQAIDLLVSDIRMPDMSGVEVLKAARRMDGDIAGIMITAYASTETAVEALRLGATDYVSKPFDLDELKLVVRGALERRQLRQENVRLKRLVGEVHQFSNMIGRSEAMLAVFNLIATIAPTTSTVLITGESGTGKELAARAIHFNSLRRDRSFVAVNCGALPETLLESELFGHMRGAFTGADANKKGLVEVADKGTIFLDEISEMSPAMQVKLLRVLQERRFRRVGGTEEVPADIRVVTASNRDLARAVADGRFREDLYYRINVIPVALPSLRERHEDIPLLAGHFVQRFATQMGKGITGISADALRCLDRHAWPGNVRELENAMERAVALEQTPTILPESLPEAVRGSAAPPLRLVERSDGGGPMLPEAGVNLEQHVESIERAYIAQALERAHGVKTRAAELLGMSFRSFRYYTKKYGIK